MTGFDLAGTTGIWSAELRYGEPGPVAEAAGELETLGYGAVWVPDIGGDLFGSLDQLLGATTHSDRPGKPSVSTRWCVRRWR